MSIDPLAGLNTLLHHARSERDAAALALRQAESAAWAAQAQADQLAGYRGQYHQRWSTRFTEPGTPTLLNCYHGFSGRLDQAITQQSHSAGQAQTRLQRAAALLLAREQRLAAVGKLIERRRAAAGLAAERSERRQLDESAARFGAAARHPDAPS